MLPDKERVMMKMEELIHHFIVATQGIDAPPGEVYFAAENPKGELGFYLISDGSPNPYRYRVRPPSLINLTLLEEMCLGHTLADAVVILGSIDIVLGEVDR
jgi:NADH-quinone oxidoreductase subunit D